MSKDASTPSLPKGTEKPLSARKPADVDFAPTLEPLYKSRLEKLDIEINNLIAVSAGDIGIIVGATENALISTLHRKLCRLLVVELNTARAKGLLSGSTSQARWSDFIAQASTSCFWASLSAKYPTMLTRVQRIVDNACSAALLFAQAWSQDKAEFRQLLEADPGRLIDLRFAAGDSHRGGRSVTLVQCEGGRLVYKPRSVQSEQRLKFLISWLEGVLARPLSMRVPRAVGGRSHGWTEFVDHVYAADEHELQAFYTGVGQWLAVMRLLGGTDLHAENLIASGPNPVVVDCETLFTPKPPLHPTGLGEAVDQAMRLVSGTVVATGLLPNRGEGLAWRGVDMSGLGALAAEQPSISVQTLIDGGTDHARIGLRRVPLEAALNHPAREPALEAYWRFVLAGFDRLSQDLRTLDRFGLLAKQLARFEACEVRVVTRPTETYAELARMLWHPVSLHDEPTARQKAVDLLSRMAQNVSIAPSDPEVIAAEVDDLLIGDIPYFGARAGEGRLRGPGGSTWLGEANLVTQALADWRSADLQLEHDYVRSTLLSAYASEARPAVRVQRQKIAEFPTEGLELRRRRQAAAVMREFVSTASRGRDGSLAWVASTLTPTGWSLQPIGPDLYSGLSGVALVTAAYLREQQAGRVDRVEGVDDLLEATLTSLARFEDLQFRQREEPGLARPPPPGGFLGLGSQIWTRLILERWGHGGESAIGRAIELAHGIPASAEADTVLDVLAGRAGAIAPLLALSKRTQDDAFSTMARSLGDQILARANRRGEAMFWTDESWPDGLGGFAHGVSGMGWALAKLAAATGDVRFSEASRAAFLFEDELFDHTEQNWLDLRMLPGTKSSAAWCHGCVGVGLARIDLDPTLSDPETKLVVRRALEATRRLSFGWSRCACHGDAGALELLQRALGAADVSDDRLADLLAQFLASLEGDDLINGATSQLFQPGLLTGQGGVLYQLLRLNPASDLPSFLTLSY